MYAQAVTNVECKFRDPQVTYLIEAHNSHSTGGPQPIVLHGTELNQPEELPKNAFSIETARESTAMSLACSYFCSESKDTEPFTSVEEVKIFSHLDLLIIFLLFNEFTLYK